MQNDRHFKYVRVEKKSKCEKSDSVTIIINGRKCLIIKLSEIWSSVVHRWLNLENNLWSSKTPCGAMHGVNDILSKFYVHKIDDPHKGTLQYHCR